MKRSIPLVLLLLLAGCREDPRERHRYQLSVPPAWEPWGQLPAPVVPGEVLEAYHVPASGSRGSLVVFRSGYVPETTAGQLLAATHYLLLNLPSLEIKAEREITVGGKPAILVEAIGDGTGEALAPTGLGKPVAPPGETLIRTRRAWVRVPRGPEEGTLEVFFHVPEGEYERFAIAWNEVLTSLRA